ncbi:MAG: hypothetical protein AB7J28_10590 [Hyphomonadaceae bacterium]
MIETAFRFIIAPDELYERQAVTPLFKKRLLHWLRPIEYIARLLLLLMARDIEVTPTQARSAKGQPERETPPFRPRLHWPQDRETSEARTARSKPKRRWDPVVVASKSLAERFEGVARVIDNPARAAKRLARRLQREAARPAESETRKRLLKRKPPDRTADTPLRDLAREVYAYVEAAFPPPQLDTS